MDSSRIKFTEKSLEKASLFDDNPFIKFIILWIGLNALYDDGISRECEKIKTYFKNNKDLIFKFLCESKQKLESVGRFIDNTPQHANLKEYLRTRSSFLRLNREENSIEDFAEFLSKIRNNMFHAMKGWDEEKEAKLLQMINPILEKLLRELIEK